MDLKRRLAHADGLIISSPEYARGVPGSLKNALDWLVGGSEFVDKPVALLSASSRSTYAFEALRTTLTTMSGRFVAEASITVPLLGRNLDAPAIAADVELSRALREALDVFCRATANGRLKGTSDVQCSSAAASVASSRRGPTRSRRCRTAR